jgi:hypothetical protein
MGRETVYCWKCSTRLQGEDFERGGAFRVGDQVSCKECVFELVADLPAEEQEAILHPPPRKTATTQMRKTGSVPPASGAQARKTGTVPVAKAQAGTQTRKTQTVPAAEGTQRRTGAVPKEEGAARRTTASVPKPQAGVPRRTDAIQKAAGQTGALKKGTRVMSRAQEDEEADDAEAPAEEGGGRKKVFLFAGIGGGVAVIVAVVLIVALSGGGKPPPVEEAVAAAPKKPAATARSNAAAEEAFKNAYREAQKFRDGNADDLGGAIRRYREADKAAEGTTYAGVARADIHELAGKMKRKCEELDQQNENFKKNGMWGELLRTWNEQRNRWPDVEEWTHLTDERIKEIKERIDPKVKNLKEAALEFKKRGNDAGLKSTREEVEKLGGEEYLAELDAALAEVKAADASGKAAASAADGKVPVKPSKPLSPAMEKYMPVWHKGISLAFARDFEQGSIEIGRGIREIDEDEVRKESAADQDLFKRMARFLEEAQKCLAQGLRFGSVTLEFQDKPGEFAKAAGRVVKVDDQRVELLTGRKEKPRIFVEIADLSAASLAEHAGKGGAFDALGAALLCLVEGDVDAAKKHAGKNTARIPERYWLWPADLKEKLRKPNPREFEARALFHMAELEWREIQKWGGAIDKFKILSNDYATTAFVRRNQTAIMKRSDVGREYVYYPTELKTPGDFNTFKLQKHPKLDAAKIEKALISTRDLDDPNKSLQNYVEIEFYAMPGLKYRGWAYIGGCCEEVLAAYYQTTEATVQYKGKTQPIGPGDRLAAPFKHGIPNLKKEHADHAKKKGDPIPPKEPTVWAWVSLPLPQQYAGAGPKAFRFLHDAAGFAVGYVIISSTRTNLPNDAQTKDLCKEMAAQPPPAVGIKGTKDPTDWLLLGPFQPGLDAPQAAEGEIEMDKEFDGKQAKVKWQTVTAELRDAGGSKAAYFDLTRLVKPSDQVSAYLLVHVKAPEARDATLLVGRDEGMKAWLNGQVVYRDDKAGLKADDAAAKIKLVEGWNRLLVKVRNATGPYAAYVRIADADKKPIEGLEYHPYGDALEPK